MSIHDEMRSWRAHLKSSRQEILPKDILELIYSEMADQEVPLSESERLAYLKFVHQSITEISGLYFQGIGE